MQNGEGSPTRKIREALHEARRIASVSRKDVLAYLIEVALAELDENDPDDLSINNLPVRGTA